MMVAVNEADWWVLVFLFYFLGYRVGVVKICDTINISIVAQW